MKNLNKKINYLILLLSLGLLKPFKILAQINTDLLNQAAGGAQYDTSINPATTIPQTVGTVIGVILSFVGAIFFILIVFAGFGWMTAGGNEEKVGKSIKQLVNGIIGLLITVAAYFITWFVSRFLGLV